MSDANPRFTLDTNVLVYAVQRSAGARHRLALDIVDRAAAVDCLLTLQSLSEFYAAVTRKNIIASERAAELVGIWLDLFRHAPVSPTAVRAALSHAAAGRASYWDALLVATAAEAGCTLILTEDLADGTILSGVEVHNPFDREGGLTARTRELLGP